jgi:hypothetical protein
MSAETVIQGALYTALTALGLRVYDAAPQAADGGSLATWPYVEVGTIVVTDWDDRAENGFEMAARVHTRSRSGSMKETKEIQGQIWARLHNGPLTLAGYSLILLRRTESDVTRVSDGSFHGVCVYRGLINPA